MGAGTLQPYLPALQAAEVLGLDAEWPPGAPTKHGVSLLQLATQTQCFIFPLERGALPTR